MNITVTGTKKVELDISNSELARAVMQWTNQKYFGNEIDDAGCDWLTHNGKVYIGGEDWEVSSNPNVVALVDSANVLRFGKKLTLDNIKG